MHHLDESEGINHIFPFAPSIQHCPHKIETQLEDIFHILAIPVAVKYYIKLKSFNNIIFIYLNNINLYFVK